MKQINNFIIEEVRKSEKNTIELSAKVDSEIKDFKIKIDDLNKFLLTEIPRDLEFLLRANDVLLSKNLMKFLKQIIEDKPIDMPVILFSKSVLSRKSRPHQPQAA